MITKFLLTFLVNLVIIVFVRAELTSEVMA